MPSPQRQRILKEASQLMAEARKDAADDDAEQRQLKAGNNAAMLKGFLNADTKEEEVLLV